MQLRHFHTPVDMNTWCNQRHTFFVFLKTQSDNYTPGSDCQLQFWAAGSRQNGGQLYFARGARTGTVHPTVEAASVEELGKRHLELGISVRRLPSATRAPALTTHSPERERFSHAAIQKMSFVPGTVLPSNVTVLNPNNPLITPVSSVNCLRTPRRPGMTLVT